MESASTEDADTAPSSPTPRLFNDLYFGHQPPPLFETWTPFSRLPIDLRLQIWLIAVRRHRMLELTICPPDEDEDETPYPGDADSRFYSERNHLGNIISGRGYTLKIAGRGYAATFSPILWVNRESRDAALRHYYRVHLPFPHQHAGRILYLNPEHDVLHLLPELRLERSDDGFEEHLPRGAPRPLAVLADFLHDVKAYDPKDQGAVHISLSNKYIGQSMEPPPRSGHPPLSPSLLHPLAAASFADILGTRLRSVLCPVSFRNNRRNMGMFPVERFHFAQNFPLFRRGAPTGGFLWLESDPRPGLEFDLRQVMIRDKIPPIVGAWKELEKAFGIEERSPDGPFRLYVCPSLVWPRRGNGALPRDDMGDEDETSEGFRHELALHLEREAEDWNRTRADLDYWSTAVPLSSTPVTREPTPRHGTQIDAETFEMMERTPCTAIALWLFPIDVFKVKEPAIREGVNRYDLSAYPPPGLFLFEV